MHRGVGEFWSKTAKKAKIFKQTKFFGRKFLKMENGGPGPGPAAGTVFGSKLESQHIELFFFSK